MRGCCLSVVVLDSMPSRKHADHQSLGRKSTRKATESQNMCYSQPLQTVYSSLPWVVVLQVDFRKDTLPSTHILRHDIVTRVASIRYCTETNHESITWILKEITFFWIENLDSEPTTLWCLPLYTPPTSSTYSSADSSLQLTLSSRQCCF